MSREVTGSLANIGMPLFLLFIALMSYIWFGVEVKKKRLQFKTMISWFVLNLFYIVTISYILVVSVMHIYGFSEVPNIFNLIAYYAFGLSLTDGREWILMLILAFIAYILTKTLNNSIKISKLNDKIDELSKQVTILAGKVNKSANITRGLIDPTKTSKEVKSELKEKIRIAKAKRKAKEKLEFLSQIIVNPVKKKKKSNKSTDSQKK